MSLGLRAKLLSVNVAAVAITAVCAVSLEEILTEFKTILSLQTYAHAILNDTIRNGKKNCDCR